MKRNASKTLLTFLFGALLLTSCGQSGSGETTVTDQTAPTAAPVSDEKVASQTVTEETAEKQTDNAFSLPDDLPERKIIIDTDTGADDIIILYTNDVHCGIDDNIGCDGLKLYKREMQAMQYSTGSAYRFAFKG